MIETMTVNPTAVVSQYARMLHELRPSAEVFYEPEARGSMLHVSVVADVWDPELEEDAHRLAWPEANEPDLSLMVRVFFRSQGAPALDGLVSLDKETQP